VSDAADLSFDEGQFSSAIVRILDQGTWFDIVPNDDLSTPGSNLVMPTPLYVISGCNPGYRASDEENDRRHEQLGERLRDMGVDLMPAVGMSPDGSWVEPSWAVSSLDLDVVCALGREFGQVAVFVIDEGEIRVVRCRDGVSMSSKVFSAARVGDHPGTSVDIKTEHC
jgi:hypothetical protein